MNWSLLRNLLDKYYEAGTSKEEEAEIIALLSSKDLPDEFAEDRLLFTGFADDGDNIPDPPADLGNKIMAAIDESEKTENRSRRYRLYSLVSVAASLLVVISIYSLFFAGNRLEDTYEDPQLAYDQTIKVLYSISDGLNKGREQINELSIIVETRSKLEIIPQSRNIVGDELKSLKYVGDGFDLMGLIDEND